MWGLRVIARSKKLRCEFRNAVKRFYENLGIISEISGDTVPKFEKSKGGEWRHSPTVPWHGQLRLLYVALWDCVSTPLLYSFQTFSGTMELLSY